MSSGCHRTLKRLVAGSPVLSLRPTMHDLKSRDIGRFTAPPKVSPAPLAAARRRHRSWLLAQLANLRLTTQAGCKVPVQGLRCTALRASSGHDPRPPASAHLLGCQPLPHVAPLPAPLPPRTWQLAATGAAAVKAHQPIFMRTRTAAWNRTVLPQDGSMSAGAQGVLRARFKPSLHSRVERFSRSRQGDGSGPKANTWHGGAWSMEGMGSRAGTAPCTATRQQTAPGDDGWGGRRGLPVKEFQPRLEKAGWWMVIGLAIWQARAA